MYLVSIVLQLHCTCKTRGQRGLNGHLRPLHWSCQFSLLNQTGFPWGKFEPKLDEIKTKLRIFKLHYLAPFCPLMGPQGVKITFFNTILHFLQKGILSTKYGLSQLHLNFFTLLSAPQWGRFNLLSLANFVDLAPRTLNIKYEVNLTVGS